MRIYVRVGMRLPAGVVGLQLVGTVDGSELRCLKRLLRAVGRGCRPTWVLVLAMFSPQCDSQPVLQQERKRRVRVAGARQASCHPAGSARLACMAKRNANTHAKAEHCVSAGWASPTAASNVADHPAATH